ncbi:MAG: hypothetical protein BIFFINMI_04236 [Phycisphaerae bacterium]|nr:hypothetical protein [Phycisphaerae bacterium]
MRRRPLYGVFMRSVQANDPSPSSVSLPDPPADPAARRAPSHAWDLLLFVIALGVFWLYRNPFLTDWDSFDYTIQAIQGQPSTLASGRYFFIAIHAVAWRIGHGLFGLAPQDAWLLFTRLTLVLAGLATVALFRAAWLLTRSGLAALIAIALWLTAPQVLVYGSAMMTETPTTLFFALAIVMAELSARGATRRRSVWLALAAGGLFAVSCNMRETLVVFAIYFLGRTLLVPGRDWITRLAAAGAGLLGFGAVMAVGIALAAWRLGGLDVFWANATHWQASMAEERSEYPNVPLHNALVGLVFCASVSLPAVFWILPSLGVFFRRAYRRQAEVDLVARPVRFEPLGWLLAGDAAYFVQILSNHDVAVNPRFAMLLMLPLMLLAGAALADTVLRRNRRWAVAFVAFMLPVIPFVAVSATWAWTGWLWKSQLPPDLRMLVWPLAALTAAILLILMLPAIRGRGGRLPATGAVTAVIVAGAFVLVAGQAFIDHNYFRESRWKRLFVDSITAPGALPEDAMLIPSGGTPAVQYLVGGGAHDGWIFPGYLSPEEVERIGDRHGWVVVPSGWPWPDGRTVRGLGLPRPTLVQLVEAYRRSGKPVYLFGGQSMWKPSRNPSARNTEWPQVEQLQFRWQLDDRGPGDMLRLTAPWPTRPTRLLPVGTGKLRANNEWPILEQDWISVPAAASQPATDEEAIKQ